MFVVVVVVVVVVDDGDDDDDDNDDDDVYCIEVSFESGALPSLGTHFLNYYIILCFLHSLFCLHKIYYSMSREY